MKSLRLVYTERIGWHPTVCWKDSSTVPMQAKNHAAIMAAIAANRPVLDGGATPTRDAIARAVENLKAILDQ